MENQENLSIFSVGDFIAVFNQTIEFAYPTVAIEGEVSSFKVNQGKYVFFDIKDSQGSINCFMTIWQMRTPITDGMKVVILATPKLTQWGKFSLTVKSIRPSGEGSIKKSFEILKKKLDDEGLFALDKKRQLPVIPKHIAVISSTGAAGYVDFLKILGDRWGGIKIEVANVQVQGDVAPDQIIRALNYFNQREVLPEVIVIIRGGGSADDLSAFNDEHLVRAIASSRIPVLTGIGHEIDESLADLAADVRASTPSNAAQIIVPDKNELIRSTKFQINQLSAKIIQIIDRQSQLINDSIGKIINVIDKSVDNISNQIDLMKNILSQLDPRLILARGYSLIRGKILVGEEVELETNDSLIKAEVKNVVKK